MPSVRTPSPPQNEEDSLSSEPSDVSEASSSFSTPSSSPPPSVTDVRGFTDPPSSSSSSMSSSRYAQLDKLLDQTSLYSKFLAERMPTRYQHSMKLFTSSSDRRRARTARASSPTTSSSSPSSLSPAETVSDSRFTSLNALVAPGQSLFMYQAVGVDWLISLFENGLNGVIADEMGLGKTLQCIVFLAHLHAHNIHGPFIIIAPLSTLSAWEAEFSRWTPQLSVVRYHGTPSVRKELRESIFSKKVPPIVITSYEIAMNDATFLKHPTFKLLVVDEGHRLKNHECKLFATLKSFQTENRLLLTGTPLQNNLRELWSLLNFLLPTVFDSLQRFERWFDFDALGGEEGRDALLAKEKSDRLVSKLHDILHPFVLRRLKVDVLQLPRKREYVVHTPMTRVQGSYYKQVMERKLKALQDGKGGLNMRNTFIQLQKVCDSSYLVTRAHWMDDEPADVVQGDDEADDADEEEEERVKSDWVSRKKRGTSNSHLQQQARQWSDADIHADLLQSCGKLQVVDSVLRHLLSRGEKVLIFSGMVRMLDLLATFVECGGYGAYIRIDGHTPALERHSQVLSFNAAKADSPCIALLSTRAAGLGLNLASASTVILYDSDWNPQMDLQAQDRAHRVGSTHEVFVLRLLTPASVEVSKWHRAQRKTVLTNVVMPRHKFKGEGDHGDGEGGAEGERGFLEELKRMFDREQRRLKGEEVPAEAGEGLEELSAKEKRALRKEEERRADEANIMEEGRRSQRTRGRKRKAQSAKRAVGDDVDADDVEEEDVEEAQQVTDAEVRLILNGKMTGKELDAHPLVLLVDDDQGTEDGLE